MDDQYVRQERLREIGPLGQSRLCQSAVSVPNDAAAATAMEYLRRSGVGSVAAETPALVSSFPHAQHFQFETCRTFAKGAWTATRHIVELLGL